ncbi:hypothetical protein F1599_21945 [Cupriavidus cauae]|uniref:Uncharacterized protein n=1 Tax=Cupriavidus cauae TaxID=2608999 RepID=A0A5M8A3J9_9BURK|nr:hypothetical protein F1599_21945 [Cupriavidus cauae]
MREAPAAPAGKYARDTGPREYPGTLAQPHRGIAPRSQGEPPGAGQRDHAARRQRPPRPVQRLGQQQRRLDQFHVAIRDMQLGAGFGMEGERLPGAQRQRAVQVDGMGQQGEDGHDGLGRFGCVCVSPTQR